MQSKWFCFPVTAAIMFAMQDTVAASADSTETAELDAVVVTGTRVANRTALDTVAPVDVIPGNALRDLGVPEITQALSVVLPSYNFPRPGLADGTDTIRPATLRGLAPDQTLVLVNGKRRHSASLVNGNGTIGRGASAVDLNSLPAAIINSVEVLRDGASAQYGSDALAGVINVRLRENSDGGGISTTYGLRDTRYAVLVGQPPTGARWGVGPYLTRHISDGETVNVSAWKGLQLGSDGFVTIATEYKDQKHTERGGYDVRQQYPLVAGAFDPRELTFNRFNAWYGDPEIKQATAFANFGKPLSGSVELYGWAGYQKRDAVSAGFYRRALDDRNTLSIYPDGFLPLIAPTVTDYSAAVGTTWKYGAWQMDSSLVYGLNRMDFTIKNTLNRSQGAASAKQFDAGGHDYDQLVFNISGVREIEAGFHSPLNLALGLEARREGYSISAGEPGSYINGGVKLPNGSPTQSGAQVFPGFRPANEVDESRTAAGLYIDLESRITEQLLASAALRAEHYSDFGKNLSSKLALRYDFTSMFAVRGTVQSGFRAPSLPQQFFATTTTNFIGDVPFDITTFPVKDPAAIALGAKPLDAEKSVNYSLGAVLRISRFSATLDAYQIDIDDRIVLSENLTQANVRAYLTSLGFIGIGGGRFFINGVDTRTRGVDFIANYNWDAGNIGHVDFTLAANRNSTSVRRLPQTTPLAALNPAPTLFDRVNVLTFEKGNPKNKVSASANWSRDRWSAMARATRYGKVLSPDSAATNATVAAGRPANDLWLAARTLVDVEGRFALTNRLKLAIGAENLFDQYPTLVPATFNGTGTTPFSNYSPLGRSGLFIYGRLSAEF
jgi:iron complex outermembrane recepter protein